MINPYVIRDIQVQCHVYAFSILIACSQFFPKYIRMLLISTEIYSDFTARFTRGHFNFLSRRLSLTVAIWFPDFCR